MVEVIYGKHTCHMDATELRVRSAAYQSVWIDLGTGDGRFVRTIAHAEPRTLVLGVDACRENLYAGSRHASNNVVFVIANALALPAALTNLATHITINFPWGSLLHGLLTNDPALMTGLRMISRPGATVEIRLNGGALAEAGSSLVAGGAAVHQTLQHAGFGVRSVDAMTAPALRACPTTWAKRLAFGRDPRGLYLRAVWRGAAQIEALAG